MFAAVDTSFVLLPERASAFSTDYDIFFWYVMLVITGGGLVVYAMLAYFCWAFAQGGPTPHKTPRILGSTKLEVAWTVVPLFFFLSFFVWGIKIYNEQIELPQDAPEYYVVGKQWMWKLQHPTGQREINELHLAVDKPVRITGTSEDVIHDFGIPAFRAKFDVIPGRYVTAWYHPTKVGTYHIFCDQYCGQGHSQMVGKVHVLSQADHEAWLGGSYRDREGKLMSDGSPAWQGWQLFQKLQCITCHNAEATARAPRLEGIAGTMRPVQGGKLVKADDAYLRRSIRNPEAEVADGWKPIMPAFPRSQVTEEEILNLIAYIKSMRPGDLRPRTDQTPAPAGASTKNSESPGSMDKPSSSEGGGK